MAGNQSRREFLRSASAITAASVLGSCASSGRSGGEQKRRPNIVLILTDDQGYGDLSCHGNEWLATPNVDRLARESIELTRFYVSPVCTPTRACLNTGRYNFRTGAIDTYQGRAMMRSDEVTLAQMLRPAGYRTGLFGKWHLGDNYPMRPQDHGFEEVLMHRGGGMVQPGDPPESRYMDPILQHNGKQEVHQGYCTDVFADAAIGFIEQHKDEPFFVYLAPNAPHTPLQVPEEWTEPYRKKGLDETTAKIYAMVANIDQNVGKVLAKLDELKLAENTIVIYMHDNGPQQKRYNAGLRGLKGSVYDGGIRSPLFIRRPGTLKPGKMDVLSAHLDVVPTLLEMCEVPAPNRKLDGFSLAGLLKGAAPSAAMQDRALFLQWHRGDEPQAYNNAAVVTRQHKLVNGKELYDLLADPAEARDISADNPQIVAALREKYDAWFKDVTAGKRYLPQRIIVGSPQENPSMLTRQDWRGPKAGWDKESVGYWDLTIARGGDYEIKLRFVAVDEPRTVNLKIGEVSRSIQVAGGAAECTFARVPLKSGDARLEAELASAGRTVGVNYVDVRRL